MTLIQSKLSAVRSKHLVVAVCTGLALCVAFIAAALMVSSLADYFIEFPWTLRAILMGLYLAAVAFLIVKFIVFPIMYGPDDETLALQVEHEAPMLASRLIASVQLSRPNAIPAGGSAALVRAMIDQTEELAAELDFNAVVKLNRLLKASLLAIGLVILGSGLLALGGQTSRDLLARTLLANIVLPTKTRVECLSGDFNVAVGDNAVLRARATGWHPAIGTAEIRYDSTRKQTVTLERTKEDPSIYTATLESVQESFTYKIRLYDGHSETFTVHAAPRPAVVSLKTEQLYPAYTGLGIVPRSTGDLSLLMGSKLRLTVMTNKPVRTVPNLQREMSSVTLYSDDPANPAIPLAPLAKSHFIVDTHDAKHLTVDLDLPAKTVGFSIELIDDQDLKSKDPTVYRVDLVPDHAPTIRITTPERKEVLVVRETKLDVGFVAEDDYGLAKAFLKYKIDDGDEVSVALALEPNQRAIRGRYTWTIASLTLPAGKSALEGSVIDYYLEVQDNNTLTGPGKSTSEHYLARVVSKADKQKELNDRFTDQIGRLQQVVEQQKDAHEELRETIIQEVPRKP